MLGIFLDSETNGLDAQKHRLIEIAFKIINITDGILIDEYQSIIFQPKAVWRKSDPDSLKINGFTYNDVEKGNTENSVSKKIIECFTSNKINRDSAVFICQNPSFDRIFFYQLIPSDIQENLRLPYHWLDLASMFWAISIKNKEDPKPWITGLSKDQIAKRYKLAPEDKPHKAINGVNHLIDCYKKVVGYD